MRPSPQRPRLRRRPVVVVGSGIAGLALCRHLGPARAVLVERRARLASESSADGVGMVRRLSDDPLERALAIRTAAWLRGWAPPEICRASGALLAAAHDPTALNDGAAHLRAAGIPVSAVSPPDVAPILAGGALRAGWWVPDELWVDPVAVTARLVEELVAGGLEIRAGVEVRALAVSGGRATGVVTDQGEIGADAVVLATGAWSAGLAAAHGLSRPLVALRRSVLDVMHGAGSGPWVWIDDVGLYLRPTGSGFLVSPCDEQVERTPAAGSRGEAAPGAEGWARDKLRRFAPGAADAPVARSWSGLRTFAPDRRPVLGADPELPGLWWVAGLGGYGLTCGAAAGEAVATWMGGGSTPWCPPALVSPGRRHLARFPIRPTGEHERAVLIEATPPRG